MSRPSTPEPTVPTVTFTPEPSFVSLKRRMLCRAPDARADTKLIEQEKAEQINILNDMTVALSNLPLPPDVSQCITNAFIDTWPCKSRGCTWYVKASDTKHEFCEFCRRSR